MADGLQSNQIITQWNGIKPMSSLKLIVTSVHYSSISIAVRTARNLACNRRQRSHGHRQTKSYRPCQSHHRQDEYLQK